MFIHALVLAAVSQPCDNANTTKEWSSCWSEEAKKADAELNATWAKVKSELTGMGIDPSVLVEPELAWIKMRDATCKWETTLPGPGVMGAKCQWRMTRAQTKHLKSAAASLKAKGSISTAAPANASVDAELNRVYKGLINNDSLLINDEARASQKSALTASELAWIAYRDKWCKVEGGNCKTVLEKERTAELKTATFWEDNA